MSERREYAGACPECGAHPWGNIDCPLCLHVSGLEAERDRLAAENAALQAGGGGGEGGVSWVRALWTAIADAKPGMDVEERAWILALSACGEFNKPTPSVHCGLAQKAIAEELRRAIAIGRRDLDDDVPADGCDDE